MNTSSKVNSFSTAIVTIVNSSPSHSPSTASNFFRSPGIPRRMVHALPE